MAVKSVFDFTKKEISAQFLSFCFCFSLSFSFLFEYTQNNMDDSSVSLIESKNTDTLGSAELSTVESHYEEQKEEQVGTVQEETTEKQYQKDNNEWYQSESALLEADNDDDIYIDQGFDAAVEYEQSQEPKPEHQRLDNDTSPKKVLR